MINIRSILKLRNNDGLTLKAGKPITYKSGWQVATEGVECRPQEKQLTLSRLTMATAACGLLMVSTTSTRATE